MTLSTSTASQTFPGNGVTQIFPCGFRIFQASDISVSLVDAVTGISTPLALNSDYTLTGEGDQTGFTLSTSVPVVTGTNLLVARNIPYTQPTDFTNQGSFFPTMHEDCADRLGMQIQQLAGSIQRTLQLPDGIYPVASGTLPYPSPLAPIVWNAAGNGLENGSTSMTGDMLLRGNLASTAPGNGSALIGFKQNALAGAIARTVQDRLIDTVSVFDFMTPTQIDDVRAGTRLVDVTAAFQAALTGAVGKRVVIPGGLYQLTSTITVPPATYLVGDGSKTTYLYFTLAASSTAKLVSINAGAPSGIQYGGGVANLSIIDQTPTSFTTGLYVESVVGGKFENINLTGMHVGASFLNGSNIIENFQIATLSSPTTAIGVLADGVSCGLGIFDSMVQSSTTPGQQIGTGYLFQGGASPTMRAANTYGCSIGCRVTATGVSTYWPELVNCQFDTASDTGLLFDCGVGGNIYGGTVQNIWSSTFGSYGIHIKPGAGVVNGLSFDGGRVYANTLAGIFIEGGSNLRFNDLQISGNGNFASPGISVQGAASNLSFIGGRIGPSAQFGNTQLYGILLGTYAISNVMVDGVDLSGNINDGFLSTSTTPASVFLGNNVGYSANTPAAPTLLNSWVNFGAGQDAAAYYKDASGTVHLKGLIKSGTLGSTAFTLPVGFRPGGVSYFACWSNSAFGGCNVGTDGQVSIANGSTISFSLAGITFKAEQ